jgi:hypothetical protein
MTFDQHEPSANSPCTKTTFLVFGEVWALATRLSEGKAAQAAAAPINVRRFIIVCLSSRLLSVAVIISMARIAAIANSCDYLLIRAANGASRQETTACIARWHCWP